MVAWTAVAGQAGLPALDPVSPAPLCLDASFGSVVGGAGGCGPYGGSGFASSSSSVVLALAEAVGLALEVHVAEGRLAMVVHDETCLGLGVGGFWAKALLGPLA